METLDRAKLAVEQAEADEIPELYDKRPNWPQAEPGHSHMTRQSPESILHSQCCKWVIVILYSTPSVPSLGCRDWVVSTFCGLAETIMSNQSWEENHTFAARLEHGFLEGTHHHHPQTRIPIPPLLSLKCSSPRSSHFAVVPPTKAILESIMTSTRSGQ